MGEHTHIRQESDKGGIGRRMIIQLVDSAWRERQWVHVPMSMRHAMLLVEKMMRYEGHVGI